MKSVFYKKQAKKELEDSLLRTKLQHILAKEITKRLPSLQTDWKTLKKFGIIRTDKQGGGFDEDMLKAHSLRTLIQIYDITN